MFVESQISPFCGVSSNAVMVGLLIVPCKVWVRLSELSTSLVVIDLSYRGSSGSVDPMRSGWTRLGSIAALRKLRSVS
ncbi:hypothetical protein F2Q68_00010949 [Brassica cretica]|uniref:Uncharacterized protein n=1 Tax=Brassica cretica TaxID=69181 RepID=A0A8S9KZX9_BRACR|nr:hypothetical protein F2Q68_00010949 [Brassica cretica]